MSQFLMELLIIDFWFPVEAALMKSFPKLSQAIEDMLSEGDWKCDTICDILKDDTTKYVASYTLSCFFLMATLHATRVIDLRTLADGPGCFVKDIVHRVKLSKRRILRRLGFGPKKRVKINENNNYCPIFSSSSPSSGGCDPCSLVSSGARKRKHSGSSCNDSLEKKINKLDKRFKCPVHKSACDDSDYSDDFDMCLNNN